MATIYCNLNTVSGLKKLNEYLLHRSYSNRYHLNSKRSSSFFCNSKKHFHTTYRRKLKIEKGHQSQQVLSERNADYSGTTTEEEKENDVSKAILIWRAVKLPIYSVALVPLTVGSAAAYFQTGIFSARRYFVLLTSSVLIITWLNLSNDVYDFDTGADKNKSESVVNLAGSQMNYLPLSGTIISASILVGFTTSLILFCSHFHQVEEDKAVGKMSPLVRLGTERGSTVVKVAVIALYFLLFAFGLIKALPFTCILFCALTLPMGKLVVRYVEDNHKDKQKIFMAKYYCVRLHALFGAALAAGLVVARAVTKKYVPSPIFS
ncbi:2-carboxy-1,4-naphthoquinone phytyltransferase, chloroplastic isoform X2 [Quercus lobata]|uniref:2-carboxy-1,4-naphthoquinone phytyltransferase, chloroplastic isoform X2 n=1 Tax=Quercus lobata TaxID=97700 RepID=UPI00124553FD|nr:2-carboxy-1,4-naphthoquinone phytyltransferase, chloroplastic isoform X2 [Quercus lobata]